MSSLITSNYLSHPLTLSLIQSTRHPLSSIHLLKNLFCHSLPFISSLITFHPYVFTTVLTSNHSSYLYTVILTSLFNPPMFHVIILPASIMSPPYSYQFPSFSKQSFLMRPSIPKSSHLFSSVYSVILSNYSYIVSCVHLFSSLYPVTPPPQGVLPR